MDKMTLYAGVMLAGVALSSFSQILLKKSSSQQFSSKLREYMNFRVIFAYGLFFAVTFVNVLALKYVPLSWSPVIESMGYVFVSILSYVLLKEHISKKKIIGMLVIILGVILFSI
ncbi:MULTISPECIES: EamA family transporter [Anaerotruncus]|jgi:small multidrug resistance pump|uniref:EamA family transporter n=1 Tax=Anaerotruncus colihominis TaxID=169435 RepID=A0A845STS9_9FIRM|nr:MULTISPECIES: EamA family transporter [Anaerotruncus]MCI8492629.1 EamA family transporter [Anaerotruncus sp.]MCR2027091.1 EamA family transporter [Anaerotruncus colihominis]NDO37664.1 EamA family transporter [Anaerotruncus colihominis]